MGSNISSQAVDSLTKTSNKIINEVINDANNQTAVNAYTQQRIFIDAPNINLSNCDLNVSQKTSSKVTALAKSNTKLVNDLESKLATEVSKQISQSLDQANTDLNLLQTNIAITNTKTKTFVDNEIKTFVKNAINNTVEAKAGADQGIIFRSDNIKCVNGKISISQDAIIEAIAQNFAETAVQNIIKSDSTQKLREEIAQKTVQKNTGLGLGLGVIIAIIIVAGVVLKKFFENPAVKVGMIILMVALLGLAGYFIYKMVANKKQAEKIKKGDT